MESLSVSSHSKRISYIEGHFFSKLFTYFQSLHYRFLLCLSVPHITCEIEEIRFLYTLFYDIIGAEQSIGSKVCIHCPFLVRSQKDNRCTCSSTLLGNQLIYDTALFQLCAVHVTQWIITYTSCKCSLYTQGRESDHGIWTGTST